MKRAPVKRSSIFLTFSQRRQLAKRSEESGAPVSEIIRRAIDEYLAPQRSGRPADRLLIAGKSGARSRRPNP